MFHFDVLYPIQSTYIAWSFRCLIDVFQCKDSAWLGNDDGFYEPPRCA
jgi:hypothetical protein